MKILVLLLALFINTIAFAQAVTSEILHYTPFTRNAFNADKYPTDSFSIKQTTYRMNDYYGQKRDLTFTLLRHDYKIREHYKYSFDVSLQIWIEQRANGHMLRSLFMDVTEQYEHSVYVSTRFLPNYFAVLSLGEFTGELFLIDNSGTWYVLPGHLFCFDEKSQIIYSFVPGECGECRIGKFNLTAKEMVTKVNPRSSTAWPEYPRECWSTSIFEDEQMVKWDMKE
jgi:hypothetical protein